MVIISAKIPWLSRNSKIPNSKLLMSKKMKHWIKAMSITWYLNFLMMQYDNKRCVKQF